MATKKVRAWHFVRENARLDYGAQDLTVEPGFVYSEPGEPVLCKHGMHASLRAYDALQYAPGPIICRVDVWGQVKHGDDKLVGQHREVLAMANVERELRLWACWCVRTTPLGDGRVVWDLLTDPRSREAVEVAERYAKGQATKIELEAAREASWTAAWEASWTAAREASWTAAWEASQTAAAWAEAAAAAAAARAAARDYQSSELERFMLAAVGETK